MNKFEDSTFSDIKLPTDISDISSDISEMSSVTTSVDGNILPKLDTETCTVVCLVIISILLVLFFNYKDIVKMLKGKKPKKEDKE